MAGARPHDPHLPREGLFPRDLLPKLSPDDRMDAARASAAVRETAGPAPQGSDASPVLHGRGWLRGPRHRSLPAPLRPVLDLAAAGVGAGLVSRERFRPRARRSPPPSKIHPAAGAAGV